MTYTNVWLCIAVVFCLWSVLAQRSQLAVASKATVLHPPSSHRRHLLTRRSREPDFDIRPFSIELEHLRQYRHCERHVA